MRCWLVCLWGLCLSGLLCSPHLTLGAGCSNLKFEYTEWFAPPNTYSGTAITRGMLQDLYWDSQTECLVATSSSGIWLYQDGNIAQAPEIGLWRSGSFSNAPFLYTQKMSNHAFMANIQSFALSPNQEHLLIYTPNGLELRDYATGEVLDIVPRVRTQALYFQPDHSDVFLVANGDGLMQLWGISTGLRLNLIRELGERVYVAPSGTNDPQVSPRYTPPFLWLGEQLYIGEGDGTIQVWNTTTGERAMLWQAHAFAITDMALSPNGQTLATASLDGIIKLWNFNTRQYLGSLQSLYGHGTPIQAIAFSPNGLELVSGDTMGWLRLWNVQNVHDNLLYQSDWSVRDIAFSPNGQALALGGEDTVVHLLDMSSGQEIQRLGEQSSTVTTLSFNPTGTELAIGENTGLVSIRTLDTGQERPRYQHQWSVRDLAYSSQNDYLISVGWDQHIIRSDLKSGYSSGWQADDDFLESVAVSPDGSFYVTGGWDGMVRRWDKAYYRSQPLPLTYVQPTYKPINALAFSPSQRLLAAASEDGFLYLWDVQTSNMTLVGKLMGDGSELNDVVFSPDGKWLIAVGTHLWLWNTANFQEQTRLSGHTAFIEAVAISPDSQTIVTASDDGTVRQWNLNVSYEMQFAWHFDSPPAVTSIGENSLMQISFNPAQETLVATTQGKTVQVWNHDLQQMVMFIHDLPLRYRLNALALSPDRQYLLGVDDFGSTSPIWNMDSGLTPQASQIFKMYEIGERFIFALNQDGPYLGTFSPQALEIYDLHSASIVATLKMETVGQARIVFVPNSSWVIARGDSRQAYQIFDYAHNQVINTLAINEIVGVGDKALLTDHGELIDLTTLTTLHDFWEDYTKIGAISPQNRYVATYVFANGILIWSNETYELVRFIRVPSDPRQLLFSPDNHYLFGIFDNGMILRWEVEL